MIRRVGIIVAVAVAGALSLLEPVDAASGGPQQQRAKGPTLLWKSFPLRQQPHRPRIQPSRRPNPTNARVRPRARDGDSTMWAAGATAVAFTAAVGAAAAFLSFSRQRGGHMTKFKRERTAHDRGSEPRRAAEAGPRTSGSVANPVRSEHGSTMGGLGEKGREFERLGTHVSSVLSAAEEAAARIKQEAQLEARRVREHAEKEAGARVLAARDEAEATKAEVERLRVETAEWTNQTRTAAETYASDRRAEAEADAAKILANAEQQAVALRQGAERQRQALELDISLAESRLRELVTGLHDLAERLDNLLTAPVAAQEKERVTDNDSLVEALTPVQSRTEEART
jgi:hypothetical protein